MQQISNNQKVAAVTIYSPMFDDSRIPRHIRLYRHTTALLVRGWLEDALKTGATEEVKHSSLPRCVPS